MLETVPKWHGGMNSSMIRQTEMVALQTLKIDAFLNFGEMTAYLH